LAREKQELETRAMMEKQEAETRDAKKDKELEALREEIRRLKGE
jgi:hypothetical protein